MGNKKITLYVPENKADTVKAAKKIFKREGYSLSQFLISELERYNRLHERGNPQQRIDVIAERGEAYRAPLVCENQNCRAEVDTLYKCLCISGKTLKFCEKCKNEKTGKTIKKIVGEIHRGGPSK